MAVLAVVWMTSMPGSSARKSLPKATPVERALAIRLEADVHALAENIGERNMHCPGTLTRAADWIVTRMHKAGLSPARQGYELRGAGLVPYAGEQAENLLVEIPGTTRPEEIIVIGAHYDTVPGSPGANDNASGVAVLLALAEWFTERPQPRTLRFVAFVNEEPPFYLSADMGSHAHARASREAGEDIVAMMALDGLGHFSDEAGSQHYPVPGISLAYPDTADFIGFVTRVRDARLLRRALRTFREEASIPSEGAALPGFIPGVGWSDHWSFWQHGYPAFLVTDTLPFRDPHYHSPHDTPERLDYERMARVADGLKAVIQRLADSDP
jgi:Zn-dependent M28 family amino/carboxypeptidase